MKYECFKEPQFIYIIHYATNYKKPLKYKNDFKFNPLQIIDY